MTFRGIHGKWVSHGGDASKCNTPHDFPLMPRIAGQLNCLREILSYNPSFVKGTSVFLQFPRVYLLICFLPSPFFACNHFPDLS